MDTISYDAAGNRTRMVDGSGSVSYQYDQLSRLTSETRQFTGLSASYTLTYSYNLGGELTSLTDPVGAVINYSYDSTGRMTNITGSSFAGVIQYASNLQYRAWGAIKSASYGDSTTLSASYNSRLLPTDFAITNTLSKHYEYNADGRLRFTQDQTIANSKFDRAYTYDHVGRVIQALSGAEARQQGTTDDRPYDLSYGYDAMNHLISLQGMIWDAPHEADTGSGVYANERNTAWLYDADGRLTNSSVTQYTYDAAGRAVGVLSPDTDVTLRQTQVFDGNGVRTKLLSQQEVYHEETGTTSTDTKTQYFVSSNVLNQVVTELDQSGQKARTFVYQGSEVLAWQQKNSSTETISWEHRDPSNASVRGSSVAAELEPLGSNAGVLKGFVIPPAHTKETLEAERTYPFFAATTSGQCILDGIETPCSMVSSENSAQCPPEGCGPQWNEKKKRYEFFTAVAGFGGYTLSGYMTLGAELDVDTGKWFEHGEETAGGRLNEDINDFLPQNPEFTVEKLVAGARAVIANASGDCTKLLGRDALAKFDKVAKDIVFKGNVPVNVEHPFKGVVKTSWENAGWVNALTVGQKIYLNPNGQAFNILRKGNGTPYLPPSIKEAVDKFGVSQQQYAFALIIHEFLHTTGKFGVDSIAGFDGKIDSKKSQEYQNKVLKACFPKKK